MTVLTEFTKAGLVRTAFGKLAGGYLSEGKAKLAQKVVESAALLNEHPESLARLFDIIVAGSK